MDAPKKKKPYVKPQIVFESFEINTHIAADCEVIANHSPGVCGVSVGIYENSSVFATNVDSEGLFLFSRS